MFSDLYFPMSALDASDRMLQQVAMSINQAVEVAGTQRTANRSVLEDANVNAKSLPIYSTHSTTLQQLLLLSPIKYRGVVGISKGSICCDSTACTSSHGNILPETLYNIPPIETVLNVAPVEVLSLPSSAILIPRGLTRKVVAAYLSSPSDTTNISTVVTSSDAPKVRKTFTHSVKRSMRSQKAVQRHLARLSQATISTQNTEFHQDDENARVLPKAAYSGFPPVVVPSDVFLGDVSSQFHGFLPQPQLGSSSSPHLSRLNSSQHVEIPGS